VSDGNDNKQQGTTTVHNYENLAAALIFAVCVAAIVYMFHYDLAEEHDTAITMLTVGAVFTGLKVL